MFANQVVGQAGAGLAMGLWFTPTSSLGWYCSAGEQDSGGNHRDSFLVTTGKSPPCKPIPSSTPVFERCRSESRHITRTDGAEVAVGYRGAADCDVSSRAAPPTVSARLGRIARIAVHYRKPNQARLMTPIRQLNGNNRKILNS